MKKINLGIPDIEDLTKKGFKCLDLHMHSTFSDGTNTPEEIVAIAKKKNLIISITDHNEIKGVKKAIELDNKRVIPGIELTSRNAKDILVYFYNLKDLEDFYEKYIKHKKIHPRRGFDLKCLKLSMKDILNALKKYKCLKVIPHPFALKPKTNYRYFKTRKKTLKSIGWAEVSHKPMFGGSDAHTSDIIGSVITAVKSKSLNEILSQIKENKTFIFGSELTIYNKLKIYLKIILSNISLK